MLRNEESESNPDGGTRRASSRRGSSLTFGKAVFRVSEMHSRLQGRPQYGRESEVIRELLLRPFERGLHSARHLWLRSDFQVSAALEYVVPSPARGFDLALPAHVRCPRFTSIGFRARFPYTDEALSHHSNRTAEQGATANAGSCHAACDRRSFEMKLQNVSRSAARGAPAPVVADL